MSDSLGVYMKGDTLTEKIHLVQELGLDVFWSLARIPKHRVGLKRMYVATSKAWTGYFEIRRLECDEDPAGAPGAAVILGDWHFLPPAVPADEIRARTAFRGFRYFGFNPAEKIIRRGHL